MGGLLVVFSFTTSIAQETLRKNSIPSVSPLRSPIGTFQVTLSHLHDHCIRTSPPHFSSLPEVPRYRILLIRSSVGAASSTSSSTGPDHPRQTSKPYTHPAFYRSLFSCGLVHPSEPLRRSRRPPHWIYLADPLLYCT
jgi:hypothetical protein